MKKILLTAFVPFGEITTNSSQEVVKRLNFNMKDVEIIKAELDVAYDDIISEIDDLLEKHQPDVILLCGQAGSRDEVNLEMVGLNFILSKAPDNHHKVRYNVKIHDDGSNALFSTIDFVDLQEKLLSSSLPIKVSLSAGGYLCNMALYHSLYQIQKIGYDTQAGFIHFPYFKNQLDDQPEKGLGIEQMVDILVKLIKELCQ